MRLVDILIITTIIIVALVSGLVIRPVIDRFYNDSLQKQDTTIITQLDYTYLGTLSGGYSLFSFKYEGHTYITSNAGGIIEVINTDNKKR